MTLVAGGILERPEIQYTTYGHLAKGASNVIWVFHALTGNSKPTDWWPGLIGEGQVINPRDHFIICANMLGSWPQCL
ncbi:MAG: hypothetical protein AAFY41_13270 [Bacteroidota bacterium]